MRIAIAGGPRVGKTTLAERLCGDSNILHGDDLIGKFDWSGASEEISNWFDRAGSFIVEGVQVPRALRKWLAKNPEGKPIDMIFYSNSPKVELSQGQSAMLKGCETVWNEILPELLKRKVKLEFF